MKSYLKLFFCLTLLLSFSALSESGVVLTDWQSLEGLKRLSQSKHKVDFPSLSNQFQNQADKLSCGPTTGAIVLNALRMGQDKTLPKMRFPKKYKKYLSKKFDPRVARYSPESFMKPNKIESKKRISKHRNKKKKSSSPKSYSRKSKSQKTAKIKTLKQVYGQPIHSKKDFGLQLRQLHEIFMSHGLDSKLRVVGKELSDEVIRQDLISNLKTKGDYVVINYKRSELGQKGGGHISPLGAYDEKTDSFLIMDVNSTRYNWVWTQTKALIRSMRSFDTKENRGYILLKEP